MISQIATKEECAIVRPEDFSSASIDGSAVVINFITGDRLFSVDEEFTDEQVWQIFNAVNIGFRAGVVAGENKISKGVKDILRIRG